MKFDETVYLHVRNSFVTIKCEYITAFQKLKRELSFRPMGYNYSPKFKSGMWDGYIQFVRGDKLMTGLLPLIIEACKANKYPYKIIDERKDPLKELNEINLSNGITLRDDQYEAVAEVIHNKRGIVAAATNAGKTYIATGLYKATGLKTLFLTHREELFTQTEETFEGMLGEKIGHIWDKDNDHNFKLTIGMVPTIARRLENPEETLKGLKKRLLDHSIELRKACDVLNKVAGPIGIKTYTAKVKKIESNMKRVQTSVTNLTNNMAAEIQRWKDLNKYLSEVEMVIVDEAHHSSAETYEDILLKCDSAFYRVGLTGTPDSKDKVKDLKLRGLLGEVIYTISNQELIELGVSSTPTIHFLTTRKPIVASDYQSAYKLGIIKNSERNDHIVEVCKKKLADNKPVLILINHTDHGDHLHEYLLRSGFKADDVAFIHGGSVDSHRKAKLTAFKEGKVPILIASLILQEGVSVNSIGALIFALGGKSNVRVLQIAGRALRLNNYGNKVEIYDFLDYGDQYLKEHSKERYSTYKKSFGVEAFAEGTPEV